MPVEKQKVIARLKALFPKANLSQKRLDAIADKLAKKPADDADEAAIDAVINDFNEVLSFEEIAKEDDRIRTLETKSKEPNPNPAPEPKNDPPKNDPPKAPDDAPDWAKAMIEANGKLLEKVTALETGKLTETKLKSATDLFEKSEILKGLKPEIKQNWIRRINLDSETAFEDQIKVLETEYTDLTQSAANGTRHSGFPPSGTGSPTGPNDKDVDSVVDNIV